jgi:hypothetical protein
VCKLVGDAVSVGDENTNMQHTHTYTYTHTYTHTHTQTNTAYNQVKERDIYQCSFSCERRRSLREEIRLYDEIICDGREERARTFILQVLAIVLHKLLDLRMRMRATM